MTKPLALDLYCGAGGATRGLQLAGFYVVGVDIKKQPYYCGDAFVRGDALNPPFDLDTFDFIWASPVCKEFTSAGGYQREHLGTVYPNQIPATRALLATARGLTCIENVPQAPIRADLVLDGTIVLDGTMFDGLKVIRRRHFELNFPAPFRMGFNPRGHVRWMGWSCVVGNGTCSWLYKRGIRTKNDDHRKAMGIDWMPRRALSQAIPPPYAHFIGVSALEHMGRKAA